MRSFNRKMATLAATCAVLTLVACGDDEPEGPVVEAQDLSGTYTLHELSQGTAEGVQVVPGSTGDFTMTATNYHVEIDVPVNNVSIIDNGTYTAMGTATSGDFTQTSTDAAGFQYEGTYAWDATTNRLTLDTTAGLVRTVLVLQKT